MLLPESKLSADTAGVVRMVVVAAAMVGVIGGATVVAAPGIAVGASVAAAAVEAGATVAR